jgi:hypothetical protein
LKHPDNRRQLGFELHEGGYAEGDDGDAADAVLRGAGWPHRRRVSEQRITQNTQPPVAPVPLPARDAGLPPDEIVHNGWKFRRVRRVEEKAGEAVKMPKNPFEEQEPAPVFDPARETHTGIVMGIDLARVKDGNGDRFLVVPGDDVMITVPTVGNPPKQGGEPAVHRRRLLRERDERI